MMKDIIDDAMAFTVMDEDGKEVKCDVLFTFDSDETGKSYIVYTDNTVDEEGNTQVYASVYCPDEDQMQLKPIETEKEWKIIEIILEELQASVNGADEE